MLPVTTTANQIGCHVHHHPMPCQTKFANRSTTLRSGACTYHARTARAITYRSGAHAEEEKRKKFAGHLGSPT